MDIFRALGLAPEGPEKDRAFDCKQSITPIMTRPDLTQYLQKVSII